MRWWMLWAVSLPLAVSWTGLVGAGWAHAGSAEVVSGDMAVASGGELSLPDVHVTNHAAAFPGDAPASELGDKHCTTPMRGWVECGDSFDVASNATLTVTLVSAKNDGEDDPGEKYTITIYDNTHAKDQQSKEIKAGASVSWKNDTNEKVKVQLKAKGPTISVNRAVHLHYEITK
jgi:hypothetical protein